MSRVFSGKIMENLGRYMPYIECLGMFFVSKMATSLAVCFSKRNAPITWGNVGEFCEPKMLRVA